MFGPSIVLLVLLAALAGVVATALTTRGRVPDPAPDDPASALTARRTAGRARSRAVLGLAAAGLAAAAVVALDAARPGWLGLPLALGPGLAAAVGLLVFSLVPAAPRPRATRTSGSLDRRHAWSFGPRRAFAVPAATAALLVAGLVLAGAVAAPDEQGRSREFALSSPDASTTHTAGPFPGWYYGLPVILVALLLLATAWLALHRVATTSALPGPALRAADHRWRTGSTRVVSRLTTAALLGYAGGVASFGGRAVHGAAAGLAANGVGGFGVTAALGTGIAVLGAVLVLLGAVALGAAAFAAVHAGGSTATDRAGEPVGADR